MRTSDKATWYQHFGGPGHAGGETRAQTTSDAAVYGRYVRVPPIVLL
jgi:hypothetical protein